MTMAQVVAFAKEFKWSEENVVLALETGFCCAYCGKHLLADASAYFLWTVDHLIPRSAGGNDTLENKVVSCRICNVNLKRRWNPAKNLPPGASKAELIHEARRHVKSERRRQDERVRTERLMAKQLMSTHINSAV